MSTSHMKRLIRYCVILCGMAAGGARADVFISELLADNENGIKDEDGDRQDWLELYNSGESDVRLDGWWLTDTSDNPALWQFPAVTISAKSYLLVWASGKDRTDPDNPLHTNFNLSKKGEYLGLYRPNPTNGLPLLVDAYAPHFPALPPDVSYGKSYVETETNFVVMGETGRYRVLTAAEGDTFYWGTDYAAGHLGHGQPGGWNVSAAFDDASWTLAATGIGYDTTGAFDPWFGTSPSGICSNALRNVNTSLCFRRTFHVSDPSKLSTAVLRMKYEDGFVAFVNGTEVGRENCTNAMAYNTKANTYVDETVVNSWFDYPISNNLLVAGANLLAIQGVNSSLGSSDFLLLPEVSGTLIGELSATVYFSDPTPGEANGAGTSGPLLSSATPVDPDVPRPSGNTDSPPLTVTVRVTATKNAIASVSAYYRTMWNTESAAVSLHDDGTAPDVTAGDGIYTADLPTTTPTAGQMFRWRFEAADTAGTVTKLPAYTDPEDSPQYFGTVAVDASTARSQLPVLEWFVEGSPTNGPTAAAFRGCCYFLTNFYDNTGHEIHGQSTAGFTKKSYDFDFTGEDRFLWRAGERRVKDINLLSNYADKTKTRNTFSHWVGEQTGTPYHFAFPVRVQLNGVFHGVLDMMENGGDRMLERNGLDPDGALYKIYNTIFTTSPEKKTRKDEDNSDLQALYDGLDTSLALTNRQTFAYDNLDIAATVNYLTTRFLNSDQDHGHKNYYLYRDTEGTREWQPIVWDVDLSQGHVWNSTENYFDDDLISNVLFTAGSGSRVYNVIYTSPEMKQMFVRRMRTLMDTLMQPPGTADGLFETRMREIVATVDPDPADPSPWTDGDLDAARWRIDYRFSQNRPREEVERLVTGYFPQRRTFLFNQGTGRPTYNGVPIPNAAQADTAGMVVIDSLDFFPASGSQSEEYVILRNTTSQAVDISGWTVDGEISYTFEGGTVIPAGAGTAATNYVGLLHLVKDACAFRARATGPSGRQRRFVQGNYDGQLSARGGTLNLRDASGLLIHSYMYAGSPTAAQQTLQITELQYHPSDPTAAESAALPGVTGEDFEYIELLNLSFQPLSMTNAWFSEGIDFSFPPICISAFQRVIIAKNPTAFALRYPSVTTTVLGPYSGYLDNGGERLTLKDGYGETVFHFEYNDSWYPATDGTGRSLVVRDVIAAQGDALNDATFWGICNGTQGTPGKSDVAIAHAYKGWDRFHFTDEERGDPSVSGPYADPDGDGRVNWVEYALGCDPRVVDNEGVAFTWSTVSQTKYAGLSFKRPPYILDVQYELLSTEDLTQGTWTTDNYTISSSTKTSTDQENVSFRETKPATADKRFFKLRLTYSE